MPIETVCVCSSGNAVAQAVGVFASRRSARAAPPFLSQFGRRRRTPPPQRATVSNVRTVVVAIVVNATRTASPTSWPYWSLTDLK